MNVRMYILCLKPLFLHQGTENSAFVQKRLAELKAENKPLGATLKQAIHALCAEEVRCARTPRSHETSSFS